jgi:pimeloyl-ACP methyl ester carboxylesterase
MRPPATEHSTKSHLKLSCIVLVTIVLSLVAFGCGGTATETGQSTFTLTSDDAGTAAYQVVHFTTEDGIDLSGRLYGAGGSALLLCHMYPADQTSWSAQAGKLAEQGYLVLTFDFRGYGKSQGSKDIQYLDRDVTAAVQYLRTAGAQEILLAGASIGGTACLKAAAQLQLLSSIRLAGVATFSAPVEFKGLSAREAVPTIVVPMMFVAAEGDAGAEGARELQALANNSGNLQILPGSDHGTDLFTGSQAASAWQLLLDFARQDLTGGL